MGNNRLNTGSILTPEEVGPLVVQPTINQCQARNVATVVTCSSSAYRIPVVEEDPASAFIGEEDEIPVSQAKLSEIDVHFAKLAGLSVVSNELAADSNPNAAQLIGDRLAQSLARVLDKAFFGNLPAPNPAGLESLTNVTTISAGAAFTNLDSFDDAVLNAEAQGTTITGFVAHPTDAAALTKLKQFGASGSNVPLLGSDPTQPTRRSIFGVPLLVSPNVTPGHIWGVPADRVTIVIREDATVSVDSSVFFTSDRTAIRGVMRVGFAVTQPAAVAKIVTTAPAKGN